MGFKDVMNFEMKSDSSGNMKPHFDPAQKHKMQKILRDMEADENDPNYHLEDVGDEGLDDLERPKNAYQRELFDKIEKQKVIDDARISFIHSALEKGLPIPGD